MPTIGYKSMQRMQGTRHDPSRFFTAFGLDRAHPSGAAAHAWQPPTDVYETADAIVVRMELAGVRPEDIEVVLEDEQLLIVRGVRRDPATHGRLAYHQMEIHYGVFHRQVYIPRPVSVEQATARCDHGFLEVVLPIAEQAPRSVHFVVAVTL